MQCMRFNSLTGCPALIIRSSELKHKQVRGFTFIELLVVVSVIFILSLAIYATFSNGIKVWQRINQPLQQDDLYLFLDRFYLDLRNTFNFGGFKFLGREDNLEFAVIVDNPSSEMGGRTVGEVIYSYNEQEEEFRRIEKDFSQAYVDSEGRVWKTIKNIKSLKLQYYFYDKIKNEYLWSNEWLKEDFPLAVRVELELGDGDKIQKFIKTVSIPVSG